ncbi:hypothetical protein C2845_PM11G20700 [Panicum miliaceum]|uniref:Uncharacterized protein n=1 Tax=Panicum miliaceum TaxID=4540 RepID=A0A3L6RTK3_PANMI|nr:hypothetical protein C2845_PM11G20700 [Panicum miliaceum]
MWACRSFLSRPRGLLNSMRRRVTELPPVFPGVASRGLVTDTSDGDRCPDDAKDQAAAVTGAGCGRGGEPETSDTSRKAPAPDDRRRSGRASAGTGEKKHLYLVLDDAKYGFGIHKVDVDDADADDPDGDVADSLEFGALPSLPKPPVVRIEYQWVHEFAVLGSNVIGMGSGLRGSDDRRRDGETLTFDTKTAELALLPDLPSGLRSCVRLAVAVGNRLYVIEDGTQYHCADYEHRFCWGGLHCLKLEDDDAAADGCPEDEKKKPSRSGEDRWFWHKYNTYYYTSTRWFWSDQDPGLLPLSPEGITAHAVHPAGRAFFVSVHCYYVNDHRGRGTFSYDTEHGRWTRHGDWELPFVRQAHYDRGLRAWVGLHAQSDGHGRVTLDGYGQVTPDGYICACEVPRLNGVTAPGRKLSKEKLFLEDPRRHVDAKLVDLGSGGRFCLVEILTRPGVDREGCVGDGDKCVLRLTTFRVEYGGDGELAITADRRPARSFTMSKYHDFSHIYSQYWQAFWA